MLILTRSRGQSIRIGDDIVVTVVRLKDGTVQLGIDAPKDVPVHRAEIWERIKRENEKS